MHIFTSFAACVALLPLTGCDKDSTPSQLKGDPAVQSGPSRQESVEATNPSTTAIPIYTYEVVNTYPHDPGAFTQGLVFLDGALFESTGLNGQSSLRKVDLKSGKALK